MSVYEVLESRGLASDAVPSFPPKQGIGLIPNIAGIIPSRSKRHWPASNSTAALTNMIRIRYWVTFSAGAIALAVALQIDMNAVPSRGVTSVQPAAASSTTPGLDYMHSARDACVMAKLTTTPRRWKEFTALLKDEQGLRTPFLEVAEHLDIAARLAGTGDEQADAQLDLRFVRYMADERGVTPKPVLRQYRTVRWYH